MKECVNVNGCAVAANRVLANGSGDYKIYVERGRA